MASNHKFSKEEMPEVRRIRTEMIKYHKFLFKAFQTNEKISKAIVHEIDWKKIGLDMDSTDEETKTAINEIENSISAFRTTIAEKLETVLSAAACCHHDKATKTNFDWEKAEQAEEMGTKYWERMSNKYTQPKKKSAKDKNQNSSTKSSNKTQSATKPKSPEKQATQQRSSSPTKSPRSNEVAMQETHQSPDSSTRKAKIQFSPNTSWTKVSRKSIKQTPKTTDHQRPSSQSTLKTFYKSTKSTRQQFGPVSTKFDFSTHSSNPSLFNFSR